VDPDPSITGKQSKKNLDFYYFVTFFQCCGTGTGTGTGTVGTVTF
jgi:hypothetical protein